jgi:hypothetical protein
MSPGRIVSGARCKEILRETARRDCAFICHKSPPGRRIVCRGHADATGGGQLTRIMDRLNMIDLIDPETLQKTKDATP